MLADDADVEPAIGKWLDDFVRMKMRGREIRAGKIVADFPEARNHEPRNEAITGTQGECDALLPALGAEVIERTQLFGSEFDLLGLRLTVVLP